MADPRILITGTGGPSGISILKDLEGENYAGMQTILQAVERARSVKPADLAKVMRGGTFDTVNLTMAAETGSDGSISAAGSATSPSASERFFTRARVWNVATSGSPSRCLRSWAATADNQ